MAQSGEISSAGSQSFNVPGQNIASGYGGLFHYPVGRIAGEVAVFYSQDPLVPDRSALAALHGES